MHDNWLIAIALGTSALGIAGLLFALIIMEASLSSIDDAKQASDGETVRISGQVTSVQARGNLTIITVMQPSTIDAVAQRNVTLRAGDCAIVQGKRGSYNGRPQISATRIIRCEKKG